MQLPDLPPSRRGWLSHSDQVGLRTWWGRFLPGLTPSRHLLASGFRRLFPSGCYALPYVTVAGTVSDSHRLPVLSIHLFERVEVAHDVKYTGAHE